MSTPAIANPASISANPASVKPSNAGSSDVPFDQVLSREVADRSSAGDAGRSGSSQTGNASAPNQPTAKPANAKAADEDKRKEAADAAQADGSAQTPDASAQLLALVADLGSLRPAPQAETRTTATGDAAPPAVTARAIAALPAAAVAQTAATGKIAAAPHTGTVTVTAVAGVKEAQATPVATLEASSGKDAAIASGTDFAATLKPGADPNQAPAPRTGVELRAAPAAEIAANAKPQEVRADLPVIDVGAQKTKEIPAAIAGAMAQIPQVALNAQTLAGHPLEKLTPQVGMPAWDQALGQKIVWMVAGAQQSATLSLNPPDLGPLQVVLNVSNSQATANFTASQPEVRQALEAALPKLRDMLGDAGIQLGQTTVGSGSANPHWGAGSDRPQQAGAHALESAGNAHAAPLRAVRNQAASSGQGLVDTFA